MLNVKILFLCLVCAVATVTTQATADAAAGTTPGTSVWKTGRTTNCPASTRVRYPGKSADYIAKHPAALLHHAGPVDNHSWRTLQRIASARPHWHTSLHCAPGHPGTPERAKARRADLDNVPSPNWSGYQSSAQHYLTASMNWVVPTATATPDTTRTSSIWPGVGSGDSTSDTLVQAGTEQDDQCIGDVCDPAYYAWFELYPQEYQQKISDLVISPGDSMTAIVEYTPDATTPAADFEVWDNTTGQAYDIEQDITGTNPESGATAEWIVERSAIGDVYPQLTDFGVAQIDDAYAFTGTDWDDPDLNGYFASDSELDSSDRSMWNCDKTLLMAEPSAFTSTYGQFAVTFNDAGTADDIDTCNF